MLAAVLAFLALCPALSEWHVVVVTSTSRLAHSTFLDVDNKYHIAWDFDDQNITFEVSVETLGYIGLGFSPNGDMPGSDIVIGWVDDSTGMGFISDRHAVSRSEPLVDDINQDYSLLNSYQNETHTVLRFTRKLELCAAEDHSIKDETVRLIWAYHDSDPLPGGSIQYHSTSRGNKNMFLLNPQRSHPKLPDNAFYIDFLNPKVEIHSKDTTYWCQSFPIPRLDRKHHIIKVEPIIQPGHESELHHMILYGCYHPISNESFNEGHECYHRGMPKDFWGCTTVILSWAIGGGDLHLPENVGFPFGYEGDPNMLLLETHYDNPTGKVGVKDSSGFRVTLTPDLREHDAGILDAGEAVFPTHVIPPHFERYTTAGVCFPECLALAMEAQPEGITVFGYMLHTHLLGIGVRVRHFRYGVEQPLIGEDSHHDFNYQYTRMMKKEVEILPGDHLIVECTYNSTGRIGVTFGGLSTRDERCIGYMLYYPRIELSRCSSTPTPQYLASFFGVRVDDNAKIHSPPEFAGHDKTLYNSIGTLADWKNKTVRERFQKWVSQDDVDGFYVHCTLGNIHYTISRTVRSFPKKLSTLPPQTCGGCRTQLPGLVVVVGVIVRRCL